MNFNDYEKSALSTAIYPQKGNNLPYAVLGLVEETGEVVEKIDRLDKDGLNKELGDQVWYIVAICFELGLPFATLEKELQILPISRNQPLLQIMEESIGRIASFTKKSMRDFNGQVPDSHKQQIILNLGLILSSIQTLAHNHGFSLKEIFIANHNKLEDRKNRNTLHGSGDNR